MNEIQKNNFRIINTKVPEEIHKTPKALQLKETCEQFESILWTQIWKKMRDSARNVGGSAEARPWKQMEDVSLEMTMDSLTSSSGGSGLGKLLYDQMITSLMAEEKSLDEIITEDTPDKQTDAVRS